MSQLPVGSSSQLGQVLVPLLKAIAVLGWPETSPLCFAPAEPKAEFGMIPWKGSTTILII